MSYDKLCDELLLMTDQIVATIVEHRDGYRVCEGIRKEIVKMDQNKLLFALLRAAQLVEKAKDYRKELGNLYCNISEFENLLLFIFPLKDNHALIVVVEPSMREFRPFINNVKGVIIKNNLAGF